MIKQLKKLALTIGVMLSIVMPLMPATAHAVDVFGPCSGNTSSSVCKSKKDSAPSFIKNIVNLLIYVTGAIAVIMIVIGGIRYTTSNGDQGQLTSAKNTILYAVVGLVVAVMAYTIVNFVLSWL